MRGKARDRKRTEACFSKVPIMNEPIKLLLLFTFLISLLFTFLISEPKSFFFGGGGGAAERNPELDEASQRSETILSTDDYRVVTKISSCRVNTTSRRGIKQLGIFFGPVILLFSNKSSRRKSPAPGS